MVKMSISDNGMIFLQGKVKSDPRLIPSPGFVIKTWMNDETGTKVFVNVCTVQLAHVLGNSSKTGAGKMYESKEEAMAAVRTSHDWCILSKKMFFDMDKKGIKCRVIHCGVDSLSLDAAREDKHFKMVLIASILCSIVDDCKIQVQQDLERIKLPRMRCKGVIPSVADWGIAMHGDGDQADDSSNAVGRPNIENIALHETVNDDSILVEKQSKVYTKKRKEKPYRVQFVGVPVNSVSVFVSQMGVGAASSCAAPKVYTRGSKIYIEGPSLVQPLCIETNLMLNGRACKTAVYKREEGTLLLEIPIISFGEYIQVKL